MQIASRPNDEGGHYITSIDCSAPANHEKSILLLFYSKNNWIVVKLWVGQTTQ